MTELPGGRGASVSRKLCSDRPGPYVTATMHLDIIILLEPAGRKLFVLRKSCLQLLATSSSKFNAVACVE